MCIETYAVIDPFEVNEVADQIDRDRDFIDIEDVIALAELRELMEDLFPDTN
jgi:hypothetical protein